MSVPEWPQAATRVTVLRHGEVAGRPHVMRGDLDEALSPRGEAQMRAVLQRLNLSEVDGIASSPRRRCAAFARTWAQQHGLRVDIHEPFREMSFGVWEGLTPVEAAQQNPAEFAQFHQLKGEVVAPGGESLAMLHARVMAGWSAWLNDAHGGHRVLVTHAGVMRVLLMALMGLPATHLWNIALPEAAHFQVSLLAGHAPVLLNLNSCVD